jgi:hypothetical protein
LGGEFWAEESWEREVRSGRVERSEVKRSEVERLGVERQRMDEQKLERESIEMERACSDLASQGKLRRYIVERRNYMRMRIRRVIWRCELKEPSWTMFCDIWFEEDIRYTNVDYRGL